MKKTNKIKPIVDSVKIGDIVLQVGCLTGKIVDIAIIVDEQPDNIHDFTPKTKWMFQDGHTHFLFGKEFKEVLEENFSEPDFDSGEDTNFFLYRAKK